jgi:DNA-binding ferritin-like protein
MFKREGRRASKRMPAVVCVIEIYVQKFTREQRTHILSSLQAASITKDIHIHTKDSNFYKVHIYTDAHLCDVVLHGRLLAHPLVGVPGVPLGLALGVQQTGPIRSRMEGQSMQNIFI